MNTTTATLGVIIGIIGGWLTLSAFVGIRNLLAMRTPPIPLTMAIMGATMVFLLYFMLVVQITHIKVHRVLCYKKSFWGPRLCRGYSYWRIGLGWGFLELGGSCAGLYLPRNVHK